MEPIVGNPSVIKRLNKDIVENVIRVDGPITKPEIAKQTDLSLVTVNKLVDSLQKENKIKSNGTNESTGGRRAQSYIINKDFNYTLALYFEKNVYVGVIANSIGGIVEEIEFPIPQKRKPLVEDIYKVIDKLFEKCKEHKVTAIGIGMPGVVNQGVITRIPQIPCMEGMNIEKGLSQKYGIKVVLENDINLAARGIYCSKYKDQVDNLAVIYLEDGIGSGIILHQELFKGSSNFAGELGYFPVRNYSIDAEKNRNTEENFETYIGKINKKIDSAKGREKEKWKRIFCQVTRDSLIGLICFLNPEVVILKCDRLHQKDIQVLEQMLQDSIGKDNLPKIVQEYDLKAYSIKGIINMCIEETNAMYLLSKGKRSY